MLKTPSDSDKQKKSLLIWCNISGHPLFPNVYHFLQYARWIPHKPFNNAIINCGIGKIVVTVFIEIFRNRLGPMEIDNIKSSIDKYKCSCQRLNAPWEKPNLGHTWCNDTTENSLTLQVNCGALTSAVLSSFFPQATRRLRALACGYGMIPRFALCRFATMCRPSGEFQCIIHNA